MLAYRMKKVRGVEPPRCPSEEPQATAAPL